ncbi:MAG: filamentous hemagglutinin N-terminal domain-containing protein, partial [Leptolyngbyaceae bacterium]|nr:filamentous hemagglutinin N-terminal domain-containing protein [Leptolyngbyaceae bacterium]
MKGLPPSLCPVLFGLVSTLLPISPALAQSVIVPDETLGEERSVVIENFGGTPNEVITGGARRAQNLFHSFVEFNVEEGRGAFFNNPDGVANIFSRVTGNNPSEIFGTLGVLGNADLYFMNPNGILFGPNASLNVEGSFAAVTADAIQFGEQGFFSAANPEVPNQLLTVDPSAFFFSQIPQGNIASTSAVPAGFQVPNGENLLFLGGDVSFSESQLIAPGGRVDIGAVSGIGSVGLNADGVLSFPEGLERADVALTNGATVDVKADDGGDIAITAQNISLTNNALLEAGIAEGLGDINSQAGDIILNATENILVAESSTVSNDISQNATGTGGSIDITSTTLNMLNIGTLIVSTSGNGNAGNIFIDVQGSMVMDSSGVTSNSLEEANGVSGNLEISTGSFSANNGSQLSTTNFSGGDAGDITIEANGSVSFNGFSITDDNGILSSGARTNIEEGVTGNSGTILIIAESLSITDVAQITSIHLGERGNAGNITIDVTDSVQITGFTLDGEDQVPSGLFTRLINAVGRSGNIEVNAESIFIENEGQISASTQGIGDGGRIVLNARDVIVLDTGGSLTNNVSENAIGNGGNIELNTQSLIATRDASLQTATFGEGDAGDIIINAPRQVQLTNSRLGANVAPDAVGSGGNINITTTTLELLGGSGLVTRTSSEGDAGNVIINVNDRVVIDNSGISTTVETGAVGNGG